MDAAGTDLLIDFLNTVDEETREDEWPDDAAARAWFRGHGLATRGVVAREARSVRDALRAAIDGRTPPPAALAAVPLHAAPAGDGLALTSAHPLGRFVAAAVALAYEGHWDRLKLCDMHSCRYAFYDTSRNRSGRWCTMSICGNRAKTRAFRERQRQG